MNTLTKKIKANGYKLNEFVRVIGVSLRTYRKYEKVDHVEHDWLVGEIDKLERKS